MTLEYERLGLVTPAASLEAAVMHWSHSVVHEKNFVSFWQAQQDASDLAQELGIPESVRVDTFSLPPRKKATCHTVVFCEEVQIFLGNEENMEFQPVSLQHDALSQWERKPWALRPISLPSNPTLPAPRNGPDRQDDRHPSRQGVRHVPAWHQDIRALLNEEGQMEDEDEELVVYATSFFIDHQRHRFHDQARILRFDEDADDWENGIRFIWEDYADPAVDIDVILVRPTPPFFAFSGTMTTVIVQQRPQHDRAACLLTAILPLSPDFRVLVTAHSMELTVTYQEVIRLARVEQQCLHRVRNGFGPCVLQVGIQHLDPLQQIQITPGLGITLRVPPPMSEADAEHNVGLRYGRPQADQEQVPATEPEAEPEDTSLMARQPRPRHSSTRSAPTESTSTSSASESTSQAFGSDTDPQHTRRAVVFPIHGMPQSLVLPWSNGDDLFRSVAEAFDILPSDVRDLHYMPHRPSDLALQGLQGLLLQRVLELRPSSFLCLVLVDIETYEDDLLQPSAFQRFPKWLPQTLNRQSVFRMLDLEHVVMQYATQTKLWLNHCLIADDSAEVLRLHDGDYLKIFIGDSTCENIRLSDVELPDIDFAISQDDDIDWEAFHDDQMSLMQAFKQVADSLQDTQAHGNVSATTCKVDAWQEVPAMPYGLTVDEPPGHPPDLLHGPRGQLHRDDSLQQIWANSLAARSTEEGARFVPFDTWFLNGHDRPRCDAPRTVELPRDSMDWDDLVIQAWRDAFDQRFSYRIVLVRPTSEPCQHAGHLILLQRELPGEKGVLVSLFWHEETSKFEGRFARFLPRRLPFQRLLCWT